MTRVDEIATAALSGDALLLRSLVQDLLRDAPLLADLPGPTSDDSRIVAVAAALVELLAERAQQAPPAWTAAVGPVQEPIHLLLAARTLPRLRRLCETESPWPLRRRRLYAPPNYLASA